MADTMSFALIGALILTLTLVPVLASYWFRSGVREKVEPRLTSGSNGQYGGELELVPEPSEVDHAGRASLIFGATLAAGSLHRRRVHAAPGRRRAVGARHHALYDFVRRGQQDRAPDSRYPDVLSAGDGRRLRVGPPRRRHRSHRLFQCRVLRRPQALQGQDVERTDSHQGRIDRIDSPQAGEPIPASSSTSPSPPRTRWTRR